ncbi:MAG: TlpA family protein disulfide reductase [Sulfurimicrobium sp.]
MSKHMIFMLALLLSPLSVAAEAIPSSAPLYAAAFDGVDGRPVKLEQFRGKVTVVNFWATWCPPCRKEIPGLVAVHAKFQDKGVEFIGIAVEDSTDLVKEFARAHGIDFPLATGKEKGIALMQALGNGVAGLPYTLVLDSRGNIVATRRGPISPERLEQALQTALGNADADTN